MWRVYCASEEVLLCQRSCQTKVESIGEAEISTIENLGQKSPKLIQAWIKHNVPQCGYCQSGQLMSAAAITNAT